MFGAMNPRLALTRCSLAPTQSPVVNPFVNE
jgi:hypothetical protein